MFNTSLYDSFLNIEFEQKKSLETGTGVEIAMYKKGLP